MIKLILATAVTFIILDAIWLGFLAKSIYIKQMGDLISIKNGNIQANVAAAILVYIVLIGGIIVFVQPLAGHSLSAALGYGILYGLVSYGTYDLTNMAVIKGWTWAVTAIDMFWGMTICAVSSVVGCYFKSM